MFFLVLPILINWFIYKYLTILIRQFHKNSWSVESYKSYLLGSLHYLVHLKISLLVSTKISVDVFIGIALNLYINLERINTVTSLKFLVHICNMSLDLFKFSFSHQDILVSMQTTWDIFKLRYLIFWWNCKWYWLMNFIFHFFIELGNEVDLCALYVYPAILLNLIINSNICLLILANFSIHRMKLFANNDFFTYSFQPLYIFSFCF